MTLALQSPDMVADIVSVDNAPIDAALLSSFAKYVEGMKKIEGQGVKSLAEALEILKDYEEVRKCIVYEVTAHRLMGNSPW